MLKVYVTHICKDRDFEFLYFLNQIGIVIYCEKYCNKKYRCWIWQNEVEKGDWKAKIQSTL
jgi:serine protease inhibitor ecotin